MEKFNSILQKIKASVHTTEPDATLILYGSYVRGNYREDSDVDLLILLNKDKVTWFDEKRITYPLYEIEYDTGVIISTIVLSKKVWESKHKISPFYHNVTKEGKQL